MGNILIFLKINYHNFRFKNNDRCYTALCTAALHLYYLCIGLKKGDEIIMSAQTHVATAHAVEICGAACIC